MAATPPITFGNFTGIDFNQIIQAEVAIASVPIGNLNSEITNENTQITALGTVKANLSLLQSAVTNLNGDVTTPQESVGVEPGAPFTAANTGSPASGVYNITVDSLATSQISASQGFASSTSAIGTGTITLTTGGVATPITVDSINDTLSGLASSINSANLGVTAQVVDTGLPGAPYRLEISSNSTGAANAFTVTSNLTGGASPNFTNNEIGPVALTSVTGTATPTIGGAYSGSLSQGCYFTVTSGGTVGGDTLTISYTSDSGESGTITVPPSYTAGSSLDVADGLTLSLSAGTLNTGDQFSVGAFTPNLATAQNAEVQAGNQFVSSASNSVTNAIPGVTLNLTSTGGPSTVTVAQNVSGESADVSTFVNAFNTAISGTTNLIQAEPGQTAPTLANNGGLETLLSNLSQSLDSVNLSNLGITVDSKTGQLVFDSTTFATNAAADPTVVTGALTGIYNALNLTLTSTLAPTTGLIASDITSIQNQITSQNTQVTNLQNQVNAEQTSLTNEYAQLQAEIVSYQNTQSFLDAMDTSTSNSSSSSSTPAPVGSNLSINT